MSSYLTIQDNAGWESAVALVWLTLSASSALLIGILTKGRFALMLPTLRKWLGESSRDSPMEIFDTLNDKRHVLRTGDNVLAKPYSHATKLDPANCWFAGKVVFTVGGIARVWFESEVHGECDLEAENIRYCAERDDDWGIAEGKSGLPDDIYEVYIQLEGGDNYLKTDSNDEDGDGDGNNTGVVQVMSNFPLLKQCCGSLARNVALLYSVQMLVYLSVAGIIGSLIYVTTYVSTYYDSTTGGSIFFAGLTLYCGTLLLVSTCFNEWQPIYTMHDFLGAVIMVCLTSFIFLQLYGNSSISSALSYRAAGALWMTVSLVPLYFFVGDRIKEGRQMAARLKEGGRGISKDTLNVPPTPRRSALILMRIFFQDFSVQSREARSRTTSEEDNDGDGAGGSGDLARDSKSNTLKSMSMSSLSVRSSRLGSEDEEEVYDHKLVQDAERKQNPLHYRMKNFSKRARKTLKRLCSCSFSIARDDVLWLVSLVPYILFVMLCWTNTSSTSTQLDTTASQRAPLLLLIVSIINELCISTLLSETYTIFGLVIASRYILVLVGSHFWLMGAVTVLLTTSAYHASQIISLYLPSPGGMVSTIYDAMADLTNKESDNRRASVNQRSSTETDTNAEEIADAGESSEKTLSLTKPQTLGIVDSSAGAGVFSHQVNSAGKQLYPNRSFSVLGSIEIQEEVQRNIRESEKNEQFRVQFFSLALLQVAIAACIIMGMYSGDESYSLYLYPIQGKTQAAWGGLVWLSALTVFFAYLVRHCVLTGGFGSLDSLIGMILNVSPLEREKARPGDGTAGAVDLSFTSMFSAGTPSRDSIRNRDSLGGSMTPVGMVSPGGDNTPGTRNSLDGGRNSVDSTGKGMSDKKRRQSRGGSLAGAIRDANQRRSSLSMRKASGMNILQQMELDDDFLDDDEYKRKYGYSRMEMLFVERNRRGTSKTSARRDEKELLRALKGKRKGEKEADKADKLRRKRLEEGSTNIIATPLQPEHDANEPVRKKIMRYFFAQFSDLVRPGLSGRTSVGFLVFLSYTSLVGSAFLGGWLAGTYIVVPLAAALPVAAFSFFNWLAVWEADGCPGFDFAHFCEMICSITLIYWNCVDAVLEVHDSYVIMATKRQEKAQKRLDRAVAKEKQRATAAAGGSSSKSDVEGGYPSIRGEISFQDDDDDDGHERNSSDSDNGLGGGISRSESPKSSKSTGIHQARLSLTALKFNLGTSFTITPVKKKRRSTDEEDDEAPGTINATFSCLGRAMCYVLEVIVAALSSFLYTLADFAQWIFTGNSFQFSLFNLLLALLVCLVFPMAYIALSLGLWIMAAAFTGLAITRWRTVCAFDTPCLLFMFFSWLPTIAWSVGIALNAPTFGFESTLSSNTGMLMVMVLVLVLATAVQMSLITYVVWSDLLLMYPVMHSRVSTHSSSMRKIVRHKHGESSDNENDNESDVESSGGSDSSVSSGSSVDLDHPSSPWADSMHEDDTESVNENGTETGSGSRAEWDSAESASWETVVDSNSKIEPSPITNDESNDKGKDGWKSESTESQEEGKSDSTEQIGDRLASKPSSPGRHHRHHHHHHHHNRSLSKYCSLTIPFGAKLSVTIMSPWALGADRPGFPATTIIALASVVAMSVLGSALFLATYASEYNTYGLGMVLVTAYLGVWAYQKAGLLSVRSTIGFAKLGYFGLSVPIIVIASGCAVAIVIYPGYEFWYLSKGWFALCFLALQKGIREDMFSTDLKTPTPPFYYPVYVLKGASVREDSANSSYIFVFLAMLSIWALWAAQMLEPNEVGTLLFVLCIVSGAIYLKCTSEGVFLKHLKDEVTPEIAHFALDRSIRSLYRHIDHDEGDDSSPPAKDSLKTPIKPKHKLTARRRATMSAIGLKATRTIGGELEGGLGNTTSTRFISVDRTRANLEFVEALVDNRDMAAAYLDETIARRCVSSLSSWPLINLIWGYRDSSLSDQDSWDALYRESLIVLNAHNELLTHAAGLNQLVALAKLRALTMAADDKRTREAELVSFLKDTQPTMSDITVSDLGHLPPSLLSSLMGTFITYKKSTQALQTAKEATARQKEKLLAAQVRERQRKADLARLQREEEMAEKAREEQERKDALAREALRKEQEERRKIEAVEQKKESDRAAAEEASRKREEEELRRLVQQQKEAEADRIANRAVARGEMSVVTTYGVELDTDFEAELARIEEGVASGELCGRGDISGHSTWTHEFPNRFADPDFGVCDVATMLGNGFKAATSTSKSGAVSRILRSDEATITVRRADTILPGLTMHLEEGGVMVKGKKPTPDNLHQGGIGDCWLIAGIATVCEQNDGELVRSVFVHADHEKGIYALRIHVNGQPRIVFVDDYLPTYVNDTTHVTQEPNHNNTQVAFCGLKKPDYFWCCLIEKAYAKVTGSFEHIVGGHEDVAMADLTGGIAKMVSALQESQNEKWRMLLDARKNGDLLGAGSLSGSDTEKTSDGVVLGHAYSILDVREIEENRLLQMRNPWGQGEWKGRWSDNSREWNPRYKKLLGWESKDDGKFWISFEDFCLNYNTIYMCQMVANQAHIMRSGCWSKTDNTAGGYRMQNVPVYNVKCDAACKLTVVLQQSMGKGDYGYEGDASKDIYMGIQIYLGKGVVQKAHQSWMRSQIVAESEYRVHRAVVEFDVMANQAVRVVCATYEENKEGHFSVNFHADCNCINVDRVPNK
jgi:hypothetical protein